MNAVGIAKALSVVAPAARADKEEPESEAASLKIDIWELTGSQVRVFGIAGHLEEGVGEVAVAVGILVEVVLMIVFGFIENA